MSWPAVLALVRQIGIDIVEGDGIERRVGMPDRRQKVVDLATAV